VGDPWVTRGGREDEDAPGLLGVVRGNGFLD
jgi:hypothetical protein